jgi:glyoxalase/bleomycin resistance protein/dioxygenase superfamily protein
MRTFGFGQQVAQIMQMAYVVEDMRAAIDWWVRDCRVGPWFLLDSFTGPAQRYRGRTAVADIRLAMSFAGHMNIELIQPKDDHPSVYKDAIDRRGYGFHHVGIAVEDVEAERAAYEARGYVTAFEAPVPSGGSVYYMEGGLSDPGFIELIPATAGMDEMFTRYWRATAGWTGEAPIRPFG